MTVSDTRKRPPDNPPPGREWKKLSGAKDWYEFSHRGFVRSLDHETNGRPQKGQVLNPRLVDGYRVFNLTLEDGTRKHGVSLARCILLAHAGEPPEPGMQACHGPGGKLDNRWPENLRWDTEDANREEALALRLVNHPPQPKPLKQCVRCRSRFDGNGRRCHPCVVELGVLAAERLAAGDDIEAIAMALDYPSEMGLFRLAQRYGGLLCVVDTRRLSLAAGEGKSDLARAVAAQVSAADHSESLLRRVTARWMAWIGDGDGQ